MTNNNCNPNNSDCFSGAAAQGLTKLGGVVLVAASAVFVVSAIHGFSATTNCRRAHAGD